MDVTEIRSRKICVTGERDTNKFYNNILEDLAKAVIEFGDVHILVGDCSGVDSNAKKICDLLGIECTVFSADWNQHGRAVGPIRNKQMIDLLSPDNLDYILAYHTDLSKSKGTKKYHISSKKEKIEDFFE